MNHKRDKLMRRLEQATSAEARSDADVPLDAETAELRETWQALGRLLEAAAPGEPLAMPATPKRPAAARWATAVAVAVSLAVVVTLAWTLLRNGGAWNHTPDNRTSQQIAEKPDRDVPESTPEPGPDTESEPLYAWDDLLDEQIALAGQEVVRVQQDWYALDDAFSPVLQGLQEISEEIDDDTL